MIADRFGLVGTTVAGKYRVERVIGEGGFGVVYAGVHLGLGQPIAIKCLKPSDGSPGGTDFTLATFQREARLLFGLTHPAIVRLYDVGEIVLPPSGGQPGGLPLGPGQPSKAAPYVVLELIEGKTLHSELHQRRTGQLPPFTRGEIGRIFDDVLSGLAFAHASGIVHRDIKPSNIMVVTREGGLAGKVLDFGMAAGAQGGGFTTVAGLTPRYASPEQWDTSYGQVAFASDLFSLGLVLEEACTLVPTIQGNSVGELMAAVLDRSRVPRIRAARPDLAALDEVVARATRVDPRERFPSAEALLRTLRAALAAPVSVGGSLDATVTEASVRSEGGSGHGTSLLPAMTTPSSGGPMTGGPMTSAPPTQVTAPPTLDASSLDPSRMRMRALSGAPGAAHAHAHAHPANLHSPTAPPNAPPHVPPGAGSGPSVLAPVTSTPSARQRSWGMIAIASAVALQVFGFAWVYLFPVVYDHIILSRTKDGAGDDEDEPKGARATGAAPPGRPVVIGTPPASTATPAASPPASASPAASTTKPAARPIPLQIHATKNLDRFEAACRDTVTEDAPALNRCFDLLPATSSWALNVRVTWKDAGGRRIRMRISENGDKSLNEAAVGKLSDCASDEIREWQWPEVTSPMRQETEQPYIDFTVQRLRR